MPIEERSVGGVLAAMMLLSVVCMPSAGFSKTFEVEGVAEIQPEPTPVAGPEGSDGASLAPGVRVLSQDPGFEGFLWSGYVVGGPDEVTPVGRVDDPSGESAFSTPKKVRLAWSGPPARQGDLLVVYRIQQRLREPRSGFSGYWVQNMAVLEVLEEGKGSVLAQVRRTRTPFEEGDLVRPYGEEVARWKESRAKKEPSKQPVNCRVAGGEEGIHHYSETNTIVLTAGRREGVVEGMVFRILEAVPAGPEGEAAENPVGEARVLYAGEDHSMARILFSHRPIVVGSEARYQP